jgi:hypothetical protein
MAGDRRVVWVLGAGFSAALGGPMLADLLSRKSEADIRVRFREANYPELHGIAASQVRFLYQYGSTNEVVPGFTMRGERIWSNAEDFIDYVDTAASPAPDNDGNALAERMNGILLQKFDSKIVEGPDALRTVARRLIAAECCGFLAGVDPKREQWRPFRGWARSLGENDTIVTFNYDRVLEVLRDAQNKQAALGKDGPSRLSIVVPAKADDRGAFGGTTPVLKLHGSVDWRKTRIGDRWTVESTADPGHALRCPAEELALATPGPSKELESTTGFRALWTWAEDALKNADAIVFVGYRFPETDAYARETLLEAIWGNGLSATKYHELRMHVVLGQSPDHARRMEALLDAVGPNEAFPPEGRPARGSSVRVHPLFAQDFFSVYPQGP